MSRTTRISNAYAKGHNRLLTLRMGGVTLKILTGSGPYTTTVTYTDDWYLSKREYTDLETSKKFKRLTVEDLDGTRLAKLKAMTAVQIGTVIYKIAAKDSFVGSIKSYEFRLYPTGEQV